jgi:hypothetical protein
MRGLVLALLALGAVASTPASAQKYDTTSPVCKTNYRWGGEDTDCGYTSLAQCRATASGLGAICFDNPYYAGAAADRPQYRARRNSPAY